MIDRYPRKPWTHVLAAAVLSSACAAGSPGPAEAFYQTTSLEGTISQDAGGVWLAVAQVMPAFMVRLDSVPDTIAPFEVGPIPEELSPLFPDGPKGVIVTEFDDPTFSKTIGIFPGDIIVKVNTIYVSNVEEFEAALKEAKSWFLVTVQRSSLAMTKARIVKIKTEAQQFEEDGATVMGPLKVEVKFIEDMLPFHDKLEETRISHKPFTPSAEDLKALSESWWKLSVRDPALFVSGEHRVVAVEDYDSSLRQDAHLEGTSWSIISNLKGNPFAGGGQLVSIYGFKSVSEDRMSGAIVQSTIAQAPFPISLEFDGAFTMFKLDDYSNKDVEYRTEQAAKESSGIEEDGGEVEVAPDIPEVVPAENSGSDEKLAE